MSEARAESEDAGGGRRTHGVVGHGVLVVRAGQAVRVVAHDDAGRGHVGQEGGRGRVEVHAAGGRTQHVVGVVGRREIGQPGRIAVGRDGRDAGRGTSVVVAAGRRGGRDHGGRHGRAGRRRGRIVVVREAEQLLDGERRALRHAGGRGAEDAGGRNVDRGRAALCVQHLRAVRVGSRQDARVHRVAYHSTRCCALLSGGHVFSGWRHGHDSLARQPPLWSARGVAPRTTPREIGRAPGRGTRRPQISRAGGEGRALQVAATPARRRWRLRVGLALHRPRRRRLERFWRFGRGDAGVRRLASGRGRRGRWGGGGGGGRAAASHSRCQHHSKRVAHL